MADIKMKSGARFEQYEVEDGVVHQHPNKSLLDTYSQSDTDLGDAISKKHSNASDHAHANIELLNAYTGSTGLGDMTKAIYDSNSDGVIEPAQLNLSGKADASHAHVPTDMTGTAVITSDSRLSDARIPTSHSHAPIDVTGTAVVTNDSRLSDARTPLVHNQDWSTITTGKPTTLSGYGITDANPLRLVYNLAAAVATSGTGETKLFNLQVPANRAVVGSTYRIRMVGNSSSTGTLIFRVRVGANGTTSDNQVWISTTSAAQVANARAGILDVLVTVRSATTAIADGVAHAGAVMLPTLIGAPATAAIVISSAWYIDVDCTCSSGTFTAQVGSIEEVK
jgi:hypothetical protein